MKEKLAVGGVAILAITALILSSKPSEIESVTSEEEYLLDEQIEALLEEEFDQMSAELTDYNQDIENEMSSDLSMFYYD